ncbi:MAG: hypothetical protein HRT53_15035 [Colwellia sp.]|nr:hypothetical protein [Colwellia sp.]
MNSVSEYSVVIDEKIQTLKIKEVGVEDNSFRLYLEVIPGDTPHGSQGKVLLPFNSKEPVDVTVCAGDSGMQVTGCLTIEYKDDKVGIISFRGSWVYPKVNLDMNIDATVSYKSNYQ